ncbi:MAG: hypothetical protein MK066_01350 [Crocinitomicaceae bacterium]|nr:hypothetical protein [Crocinitomicaceae bacterium]
MKTIIIFLIYLSPSLAFAQIGQGKEPSHIDIATDSATVQVTRQLDSSDFDRISNRLLCSYPHLISVGLNSQTNCVKFIYSTSITDEHLNQLIHYFK